MATEIFVQRFALTWVSCTDYVYARMSFGSAEPNVRRDLYGGAVQLTIPHRFVDISDFRPIPDHQEVRTVFWCNMLSRAFLL